MLNPYKITWAILFPAYGVARKEDRKLLNIFASGKRHKHILLHAPTKEMCKAKLDVVTGRFIKPYKVLLITDKQFSMVKNNDFMAVATKKQVEEMLFIS